MVTCVGDNCGNSEGIFVGFCTRICIGKSQGEPSETNIYCNTGHGCSLPLPLQLSGQQFHHRYRSKSKPAGSLTVSITMLPEVSPPMMVTTDQTGSRIIVHLRVVLLQ